MAQPRVYQNSHREYVIRLVATTFNDECWEWPFARRQGGYGYFGGEKVLVHRYAFMLRYGHFPQPCGMHKCDNPPCFNPAHIIEGTLSDNTKDAFIKGRISMPPIASRPRGEASCKAKLTEALVLEIRSRHPVLGYRRLAKEYGVTRQTIRAIIKRQSWGHV